MSNQQQQQQQLPAKEEIKGNRKQKVKDWRKQKQEEERKQEREEEDFLNRYGSLRNGPPTRTGPFTSLDTENRNVELDNAATALWGSLLNICEDNMALVKYPPYLAHTKAEIFQLMKSRVETALREFKTEHPEETYRARLVVTKDDQLAVVGEDVDKLPDNIKQIAQETNFFGMQMFDMISSYEMIKNSQHAFLRHFLGLEVDTCLDPFPDSAFNRSMESICHDLLEKQVNNIFNGRPGCFDENPFDLFPGFAEIPPWWRSHCASSIQREAPVNQILAAGLTIAHFHFYQNAEGYSRANPRVPKDKGSKEGEESGPPEIVSKFNYQNFFTSAVWQVLDQNQKCISSTSGPSVDPYSLGNEFTLNGLGGKKSEDGKRSGGYKVFAGFPKEWKSMLRNCAGWSKNATVREYREQEGRWTKTEDFTLSATTLHLFILKEFIGEMIQLYEALKSRLRDIYDDEFKSVLNQESSASLSNQLKFLLSDGEEGIFDLSNNSKDSEEQRKYLEAVFKFVSILREREDVESAGEGESGSIGNVGPKEIYERILKGHANNLDSIDLIMNTAMYETKIGTEESKLELHGFGHLAATKQTFKSFQDLVLSRISNYLYCLSTIQACCRTNGNNSPAKAGLLALSRLAIERNRERFCMVIANDEAKRKTLIYNTNEWVWTVMRSTCYASEVLDSDLVHMFVPPKGPTSEGPEGEGKDLPPFNFVVRQCWFDKVAPRFSDVIGFINTVYQIPVTFEKSREFNSFFLILRERCNPEAIPKRMVPVTEKPTSPFDAKIATSFRSFSLDNRLSLSHSIREVESMLNLHQESKDIKSKKILHDNVRRTIVDERPVDTLLPETLSNDEESWSLFFNLSGWSGGDFIKSYSLAFGAEEVALCRNVDVQMSSRDLLLVKLIDDIKPVMTRSKVIKASFSNDIKGRIKKVNPQLKYDSEKQRWTSHGNPIIPTEEGFYEKKGWVSFKKAIMGDSYCTEDPINFTFMMYLLYSLISNGSSETSVIGMILSRCVHYVHYTKSLKKVNSNEGEEKVEKKGDGVSMLEDPLFNRALNENFFEWGIKRGVLVIHGESKIVVYLRAMFGELYDRIEESHHTSQRTNPNYEGDLEAAQLYWFKKRCWDLQTLFGLKEGNQFSWKKAMDKFGPGFAEEKKEGEEEEEAKDKDQHEPNTRDLYDVMEEIWLGPEFVVEGLSNDKRNYVFVGKDTVSEENSTTETETEKDERKTTRRSLLELYLVHYASHCLSTVENVNVYCKKSGLII